MEESSTVKKSKYMMKRHSNVQESTNMAVQAPIDRLRTLILFVFPALGGLLFGEHLHASNDKVFLECTSARRIDCIL